MSRDCEDYSKRSTLKGLFCNLHVVCRLMEGWIEHLDEYNYKYLQNYQKLMSIVRECQYP